MASEHQRTLTFTPPDGVPVWNIQMTMLTKLSMTVDEATAYCGIGKTKLYELVKTDQIAGRKMGRKTLLLTASIDEYVMSLPALKTAA